MGSRSVGTAGRSALDGRARVSVLVAAAVVVAAVGGAFGVLRSGDHPSGARRRHPAPAAAPTGTGGDGRSVTQAGAVSGAPAAPAAMGAGAPPAPSDGTAAGPASAPGATAPKSSGGAGGSAPPAAGVAGGAATSGSTPAAKPAPGPAAGGQAPGTTTDAPGWRALPPAPIGGRVAHSAVWTGREMVVWGGLASLDSDPLTDGAAYDPATRTWRRVAAAPLTPRYDPAVVWSGREMLVFGGTSVAGDILADGAAWDPATGRWRALPASPLGARDGAVVAWAGDRLVVWGGATVPPPDAPATDDTASEMKADGAAYVPATDTWVPVAAAPIPARSGAESVWTGTRLVITGGYHEGDEEDRSDGAALDLVSGAWAPIAPRPAPGSCGADHPCAGLWTGSRALFPASGLAYDSAGDRWSAMPPYPSADSSLAAAPAVWTGSRLLAWGAPAAGTDDGTADPDAGAADPGAADAGGADAAAGDETDSASQPPAPPVAGAYDPGPNGWQPAAAGPLRGRVLHTAVWTGQVMIVWGGTDGDRALPDGAAFRPAQ